MALSTCKDTEKSRGNSRRGVVSLFSFHMELPPTGYLRTQVADVTVVISVAPCRPWGRVSLQKSTMLSTSEKARDRNEGANVYLALDMCVESPSRDQAMDTCAPVPAGLSRGLGLTRLLTSELLRAMGSQIPPTRALGMKSFGSFLG